MISVFLNWLWKWSTLLIMAVNTFSGKFKVNVIHQLSEQFLKCFWMSSRYWSASNLPPIWKEENLGAVLQQLWANSRDRTRLEVWDWKLHLMPRQCWTLKMPVSVYQRLSSSCNPPRHTREANKQLCWSLWLPSCNREAILRGHERQRDRL